MPPNGPAKNIQASPLHALEKVLACPKCEGGVSFGNNQFQCKKCRVSFRNIAGIPWFFEHADKLFWDWKYQVEAFLKSLDQEIRELEEESQTAGLLALTQKRLERSLLARCQVKALYRNLFAPFLTLSVNPLPWQSVPQTKIPLKTSVGSYTPNLFRDWAWGEEENKLSLELIRKVVGNALTGKKVLVLGAGSGRLAYDLHSNLLPDLTIALDNHPLHVLSAQQMFQGQKVSLYEFPLSPKDSTQTCLLRTLSAPKAAREGLQLLFADGTQVPFQKESFDFILTPWFIDVVPVEFPLLLNRINQALKIGGSWVHFGPLGFSPRPFKTAFAVDEILEITKGLGFDIQYESSESIPYLKCPESLHSRLETIHVISAKKKSSVLPVPKNSYLPKFLTDLNEPVPVLKEFVLSFDAARSAQVFISFIDGKRSINQIVEVLTAQTKFPENQTRATLVHFFTYLFEQAKSRSGV